jgi:hypothetical protein
MVRTVTTWCNPWLALVFRLYLGGLFIYASIYKINYAAEFAETIASYQIVPYFLVNLTAVVLPWTELICGTLLLAGIRPRAPRPRWGLWSSHPGHRLVLAHGVPIRCAASTPSRPHFLENPGQGVCSRLAMAVHVFRYDRLFHLEETFSWSDSGRSHAIRPDGPCGAGALGRRRAAVPRRWPGRYEAVRGEGTRAGPSSWS